MISRVRQLLGLKEAAPAAPLGRLITSAGTAADKRTPPRPAAAPPPRPPQVSSGDALRTETPEPDARSVEGGTLGSGREDYLDTLDAAFDSLDQHLAGRHPDTDTPHRNPSGPLGQASGAADPRSPGRGPSPTSEGQAPNSVFEVDSDWFPDGTKERDRAARRELLSDARQIMPPRPVAPAGASIFEVDDAWFAGDEQTRQSRVAQQRDVAAELGAHDVELPPVDPGPNAPAVAPPVAAAVPATVIEQPVEHAARTPGPASAVPVTPPDAVTLAPSAPGSMADDFAALLAFETGDGPAPPQALVGPAVPVVEPTPAPEITDAMLDQIAQRVADRLNAATLGAELRDAMTATVRETVRSVVSETSERLVRDEIARVKARAERDTP